jgi:hypothetical protein
VCSPGDFCTNVVASDSGTTTAPVIGSGWVPAWMAVVASPAVRGGNGPSLAAGVDMAEEEKGKGRRAAQTGGAHECSRMSVECVCAVCAPSPWLCCALSCLAVLSRCGREPHRDKGRPKLRGGAANGRPHQPTNHRGGGRSTVQDAREDTQRGDTAFTTVCPSKFPRCVLVAAPPPECGPPLTGLRIRRSAVSAPSRDEHP